MRIFSSFSLIATTTVIFAASAAAQTTYNWTGPATNDLWNDATHWDLAPDIPGSALNSGGAIDDDVVIMNQLAAGTQNVRLQTDAGTIGTLSIGGASGGGANTNFQMRTNNSNLNVTGDVTLGFVSGATSLAGQLFQNNGDATLQVGGDIVSVGTNGALRVSADGGTGANINLAGSIDPSGANRIDLWINRSTGFTTVAGSTHNVDSFRVGTAFNGNRTGATRAYTLDGGRTINATNVQVGFLDGNNATNYTTEGTLDINDATLNSTAAINIGQTNSATAAGERDTDGTVNVGAGGVLNTGGISLGNQNGTTVNAGSTSIGRLNLNDATADVNTTFVNVGTNLRGEGEININAGTLDTTTRLYIAGDSNGTIDAGTVGRVTVNSGGTLTVGSGNTEVGRGGQGFLTVDGGTYNQVAANLVLGQSRGSGSTTQVATGDVVFENGAQVTIGTGNNDINFNRGGGSVTVDGAATVVDIGRNVNMSDEGASAGGSFSSTFTINEGTVNVGTGNVEGDFQNANTAGSVGTVNISGGTLNVQDTLQVAQNTNAASGVVNITGGDVNIGLGGTNRNLNFSQGNATATLNISGGTLDVGNNVDYRGGSGADTFTVSGNAAVTIGNTLDMDAGVAANQNKLILQGSGATFDVGRNALLDNNAEVRFDLDAGGVTVIDIVGDLNLVDADLILDFSGSGLASTTTLGDIDLFQFDGSLVNTGTFSNIAYGDTVQSFGDTTFYTLEMEPNRIFLMSQIPEPSSAVLVALSGLALLRRRRR